MELSLEGKVAIVTGGSRGIGLATALAFARSGADLVVAARKTEGLEKAVKEILAAGKQALAVPAHIGRLEDIDNLISRTVERFGKIDILVNNAAANPTPAPSIEIEERAWDSVMNLNLKGLFFLSQAAAKVMRERGGGCIINVASVLGVRPGSLPIYSISKAGVIMATKVMAKEWAHYGIRVNAVSPGVTRTRFSEYLWSTPEISRKLLEEIPLSRFGEVEDMVGAMVYLASDASAYVTGAVIPVDGGAAI